MMFCFENKPPPISLARKGPLTLILTLFIDPLRDFTVSLKVVTSDRANPELALAHVSHSFNLTAMVVPNISSSYKSSESYKLFYFVLAIVVNLLAVACLLIAWHAKGINNDNLIWALLLVGIVSGSGVVVCCLALFILCKPWSHYEATKRRVFDVQTVYPTPEFQYFTNTMLNRVQSKMGSRGSDFSMVSTLPAGSPGARDVDVNSVLDYVPSPLPHSRPPSLASIPPQQQASISDLTTTTTCTGDSLALSLESAFGSAPAAHDSREQQPATKSANSN